SACRAGKFAVLRLDPNGVVGLAVGADAPRVRDGACDGIHLHYLPTAARVIRDNSLRLAQTTISRHLGSARAAIPHRFRALDVEADAICGRRRIPAEVLVCHYRHHSDVVYLWLN